MIKLPNNLPDMRLVDRDEAKRLLCACEYGTPIEVPKDVVFEEELVSDRFCAGKSVLRQIKATVTRDGKSFSFPFHFVSPTNGTNVPAVVLINFRSFVPDEYLPSEEISDLSVAVASFNYQDISPDDNDFESLAGDFLGIDRSRPDAPGKIAIWSWAASIVMNYVETRPEVDVKNTAVAGHSRLGKTSLYAGLFDERFKFVWSNDSGCSGAALYRWKVGETAEIIHRAFPFWFCPNFANYTTSDDALPFDQHWLLSLIAPRHVYVSSAIEDTWSDPQAELRACVAASEYYEELGIPGLIGNPENAGVGLTLHDGNIGYHCRSGGHYLSREDWQLFVEYMNKHLD